MTVNGREVELVGNYYISTSICDSHLWNHSSSLSMGKWHTGTRKQVVLEKVLRRIKYSKGNDADKLSARNLLFAEIQRLGEIK